MVRRSYPIGGFSERRVQLAVCACECASPFLLTLFADNGSYYQVSTTALYDHDYHTRPKGMSRYPPLFGSWFAEYTTLCHESGRIRARGPRGRCIRRVTLSVGSSSKNPVCAMSPSPSIDNPAFRIQVAQHYLVRADTGYEVRRALYPLIATMHFDVPLYAASVTQFDATYK